MSSVSRIILVFALIFAASTARADEPLRKWTNPQGKSFQGRLVAIEGGTARLELANGSEVSVALEKFGDEDREYLRSRSAADGSNATGKSDAQPKDDAKSGPTAATKTATVELKKNRKWSDRLGKQITARFIRFHEGKAILMQGNKPVDVPFGDLSEADQTFLRERFETLGKADDVPPVIATQSREGTSIAGGPAGAFPIPNPPFGAMPPNLADRFPRHDIARSIRSGPLSDFGKFEIMPERGSANEPAQAATQPPATLPAPYSPPAYTPPASQSQVSPVATHAAASNSSAAPAFDPAASQTTQPIYQRQTEDASRSIATSARPSPFGSSFFDSPSAHQSQPEFSSPSIPFAGTPQTEEMYQCMTCKRTITKNVKLGDKCPHCGVTFTERVDESGKTVEKKSGLTERQWVKLVGLGVVALFAVVGAVAKAMKG